MNHYNQHIQNLFYRNLELRHTASQIKTVLKRSIVELEKSTLEGFIQGSALAITDWTGPTDQGWDLVNHTGIHITTYRETYSIEIEKLISQECLYAFAQSFEALNKYLKDCVFTKIKSDAKYCSELKILNQTAFQREEIKGGDSLFRWVKIACDPLFTDYSKLNNKDLKFKEFWTTLSEVRHAITHSNSIINIEKLKKTNYHFSIFCHLFNFEEIENNSIKIQLSFSDLSRILDRVSEFGYQVFKMLSINEKLSWEILKKN